MRWLVERSLRRDFTLIVLGLVVVPLAITGVWLARSTADAGEALLRARLDVALVRAADDVSARWARTRGALLDVAERADIRQALSAGAAGLTPAPSRQRLPDGVRVVDVVDARGTSRWRAASLDSSLPSTPPLPVALPLFDASGTTIGSLRADLDAAALLAPVAGFGVAMGVAARATGVMLVTPPFAAELARRDRFTLGGQTWLAERRELAEPPIVLTAAGPLADFADPFAAAARRGLIVLAIVVALASLGAAIVTRRTTRSLERLARVADAIAEGDLGRSAEAESGEAGRLAAAINAMSASLRGTMRELAQRESLAAIGQFAAGLSHEIRNPLASIRLDLQRVQEKLGSESPLHAPLARALGEVDRLNRTVGGALRVARSGQVPLERIDVLVPLGAAIAAATPELERRGTALSVDLPRAPAILVDGNGAALEQLFLNLLLNAAQSIASGGQVSVSVRSDDRSVETTIRDTGVGIPPERLAHVFEPFFTTRSDGTGLGLAIVRGIAAAHRGDVALESVPGVGTTARVRIPAARRAESSTTGEFATRALPSDAGAPVAIPRPDTSAARTGETRAVAGDPAQRR
jgi:signal transduction histidine kinase